MNKNSAVKIIENNNIEKEPKKNFIKIKIENFEESLERNKQEEKKRLFNSGFNALNKNYKLQNNNNNNNNKSNSNEKKNNKNNNNNNKINSKFDTKITKIEKKPKENNNNNNKSRPSTAPEKNQIKKPELKEEEFQIIQNNQKSSTIITDTDSSFEENNLNDFNNNIQNSNSVKFNHKNVENEDFSSSEEEENYYKYNLTDEKKDEESFSENEEEIVKEVVKDEKEKKEKIKEKEKLEKEIKEYEKKINKIKNDIKNYLGESEFNFFMNLYKQIEKNNEEGEIEKIFLIIDDFINKKIEENKFNLNLDLKELYLLLISYDFQIMSLKKNIIENFQ